jgi:transposase-like protein
MLGVSVSVNEQEMYWRQFLQRLLARGLCGVQLITSDTHTGLQAARVACFSGIPGG